MPRHLSAYGRKPTLGRPGGWPGGGVRSRPEADLVQTYRMPFDSRVRLYVSLLAGPDNSKIEPYQGG